MWSLSALSLSLWCCLVNGVSHAKDGTHRPVSVGLYQGQQSVYSREAEYGVKFDHVLLFQPVQQLNHTEVASYLDRGHAVILNIEFRSHTAVLQDIADGKFDAQLTAFSTALRDDGRAIKIRTLHEPIGNWYPWGLQWPTGENTVARYEAAWLHVTQIFKRLHAPVLFQLDINNINGNDNKTPFKLWLPTSTKFWDCFSSIGVTVYNRAYLLPSSNWSETFTQAFDNAYHQIAALTDKPLAICEIGTVSYGTDKDMWYQRAFKDIALRYTRVNEVTFFWANKVEEGRLADWDLNNSKKSWIAGYHDFCGMIGK